jgi:hypothetical protein
MGGDRPGCCGEERLSPSALAWNDVSGVRGDPLGD